MGGDVDPAVEVVELGVTALRDPAMHQGEERPKVQRGAKSRGGFDDDVWHWFGSPRPHQSRDRYGTL
jgi:hypothetical protein